MSTYQPPSPPSPRAQTQPSTEAPAPARLKRRKVPDERKRTARACDQCRRWKEKCEGGIPCRKCSHLGRPCRVRGVPVSQDISTRDALVELQERAMYMERILKHAFKGIALDTKSLRQMAMALSDEADKETQETDEAELTMEEEECTIDPVEDTVTHFSGEFSYWNFSMRVKRQIEDRMASSLNQAQSGNEISNYPRAKQLRSSSRTLAAAVSCIPPRHIAEFLIGIFFKHAVTHYFYVDRPWLLSRLTALYTARETLSSKDAPVLSIILTVFAIGTQYAYLEADSAPASSRQSFSEDELGTMFYQEAIRLLPEIIEVSSLESVQACLLFAAYALPIDAAGLGYVYINLTIRLAMQNGMHRRCLGEPFSAAMMETRNRVWWTAYAMERKISIFHGRPLGMLRSDVDTHLPVALSEQDSTAPYMVASIHLTHHLEDFYKEISLLRTTSKQDLPLLLSNLADRKSDLEKWWTTLPLVIQKNDGGPVDRSTAHLKLEHCLLRMFIGRPFLFSRGSPSNPTSPDTSPSGSAQKPTPRQELVSCCITAANKAISICSTLRDNDGGPGLARASYIEYSSCRAALLVLIAYSIQDHSDHFRKALRVGLDMIREMAASGESARSEVELIEALERALVRLRSFDERGKVGKVASDYEEFKQWESMWKRQNDGDTPGGAGAGSLQETWPTGEMVPSGMAESNANLGPLRLFDGAAEWALFGGGSALPSALPRELQHPETQMLGDFLSLHDPRFDPDLSQSL